MNSKLQMLFILIICCISNIQAQQTFAITHGPYLQGLAENEVTIVWTTNKKGVSWVELAPDDDSHFYLTERPRFYSEDDGFKVVDSVHMVTLTNLQPKTTYRYRIYAQEVLSHVGTKVLYGNTVGSNVYQKKPLAFTTLDPDKKDISFLVLNDIHGHNTLMEDLLKNTEWKSTDLVFFNGDMTNDIRSEKQLFSDFLDKAVELFASETPMYYARGNHETRGNFATAFPRYFPTSTGQLYYTFRQGPICFIVLDCGEDKPDSDIDYSNITAFDNYRTKQAEWLKEVTMQDDFQKSAYRVIIAHIPPFGGWHGDNEVNEKFVPVLNQSNIDLMLCGHLHRQIIKGPNEKINFPIIVNSNQNMIRVSADYDQMDIQIINRDRETVDSLIINSDEN